jgi:hypothetical protein
MACAKTSFSPQESREMNQDVSLELDLFNNAVDFISTGVDELFDDRSRFIDVEPPDRSIRTYKYGVLHLYSGFLLLLKERLRRHLEELIFAGNLGDTKRKLAAGKEPNTVDLHEALERLEIGPKITFSSAEIRDIERIQRFRNRFEHYKCSANTYELWSALTRFLALIERFLVGELEIRLDTPTDEASLVKRIRSIKEVWEQVKKKQVEEWEKQTKAILEEFRPNREQVLSSLKWYDFIDCPECEQRTLMCSGEYAGICANDECEACHPIRMCPVCHNPAIGYSWDNTCCRSCQAEIEELAREGMLDEEMIEEEVRKGQYF